MDFIDHAGERAQGREPSPAPASAPAPEPRAERVSRPLHPRLARLLRDGPPAPEALDRFIAENRFPLVEPGAATFVCRGEADAIYLRHFMRGPLNGLPFERVPGTDLWHLRLRVPRSARMEYKLDVVRGGEGNWINDPLNPRLATDPFGANSVCHTYGYQPPEWIRTNPHAPAGRLEEITVRSRAFRSHRRLRVYLPHGYDEGRDWPLVVLHDGEDFAAHAGLTTVLDNLIHRGEVRPFVAALSNPHARNDEYTDCPRHADHLARELLPALGRRFRLSADPADRVLMGASLGAVASLSTAVRHPGLFGALALKSGSFVFDRALLAGRDPLFEGIADFGDTLRESPEALPPRVFVGCGAYEGLIGQNRVLAHFLRDQGVAVRFVETGDAHHWHNWRDQLHASLSWTLPARA